jgi:proteasome lid subunit RPN8/RPN11
MPFRLLLDRNCCNAVVAHALAQRPLECVGLLAGRVEPAEPGVPAGRVTRHYPLVNELASPVEYHCGDRSLFDAHKDMRRQGLDLLAIYHSHPTSPPEPSRKDLERNWHGPDVVHLIVSLTTDPPTLRGWRLTDVAYQEAEVEVADPGEPAA